MATIEVKRRLLGNYHPWEEIPVYTTGEHHNDETANASVARYAKQPDIVEVRWNWKGSPQGHYISGPSATREKHRNGGKDCA